MESLLASKWIAISGLVLGLILLFAGYRLFRVALVIIGVLVGFYVGAHLGLVYAIIFAFIGLVLASVIPFILVAFNIGYLLYKGLINFNGSNFIINNPLEPIALVLLIIAAIAAFFAYDYLLIIFFSAAGSILTLTSFARVFSELKISSEPNMTIYWILFLILTIAGSIVQFNSRKKLPVTTKKPRYLGDNI